jgi:hypothetical protein
MRAVLYKPAKPLTLRMGAGKAADQPPAAANHEGCCPFCCGGCKQRLNIPRCVSAPWIACMSEVRCNDSSGKASRPPSDACSGPWAAHSMCSCNQRMFERRHECINSTAVRLCICKATCNAKADQVQPAAWVHHWSRTWLSSTARSSTVAQHCRTSSAAECDLVCDADQDHSKHLPAEAMDALLQE